MKKFQLALLCFVCVVKIYGQTVTNSYGRIMIEITKEKKTKRIYSKVEIMSPFPGGDSSWVRSAEKNINQSLDVDKRIKKGKYIASAKFIVSKDGSLAEIMCDKDPGFGICDVVIRVLKKTKKWTPAEPVKVRTYRVTNQ